jgi:predicted transcriptional regulator
MQSKDIREALQLGKEKRIDHGVKRLVDAGKVLNVRGLYYLPGQSLPESHAAPPMAQQIRDFLKTGPKTTREILKAIPGNKATILTTLSRVCQRGERKGRVQTWLLPD